MIDSQKIDDFFGSEDAYKQPLKEAKSRQSSGQRFIKLVFPCIAAILLGLMIVMPNIKKSVDLKDDVTIPRKNEMEKLHMEETVFHATDAKNRINKVVAESLDEVEVGSQKFKIVKPNGQIPTDNGIVDITADNGFFQQNGNILELRDNVKIVVDSDTVISTQQAIYDFDKEYGHGNLPVFAKGKWGKMQGKSFTYDKKTDVLTLLGKSRMDNDKGTLTAIRKARYYRNDNKIEALGNARITQNETSLRADKIEAYFATGNRQELQKVRAYGNVVIATAQEIATGAEGYYDALSGKTELWGSARNSKNKKGYVIIKHDDKTLQGRRLVGYFSKGSQPQLQKAEIFGDVFIETPKGTAQGNRGLYNPHDNTVELFEQVQIEQDGNFIKGAHAITDLTTSVSRITGDETTGGRISGIFYKRKK